MKTPKRSKNFAAVRLIQGVAFGLGVALGLSHCGAASGSDKDLREQIGCAAVFYQPLVCVGPDSPTEAQNEALWAEIRKLQQRTAPPNLPGLEEFVATYPDSPWTPSVHANLGRYDYEHGLYTRALKHWEAAWATTRLESAGPGKQVADFTFVYWTRLLASLGRKDTLRELLRETAGRTLVQPPLQQVLNETKEGYRMMCTEPGACFKCGTYALMNVGRALKGPSFAMGPIDKVPSPVAGFTMTRLMDLAQQSGLDLVPAEWGPTKRLLVPSIIHWSQNHYAALVEQRGESFLVVDPTFDKPRWMQAPDIMEEASGHFLVPKGELPHGWRILSGSETDQIAGRGTAGFITDPDDGCGNGSGGGAPGGTGDGGNGATSGGGTGGGAGLESASGGEFGGPCSSDTCGGGGGSGGRTGRGGSGGSGQSCPTCPDSGSQGGSGDSSGWTAPSSGSTAATESVRTGGMPFWEVSEPYINVWLYDEPLGYQPGLGYRLSLRLAYKQRESRTFSTNVFSFGPMWDCSWLSYVEDTYPRYGYLASMLVGGGETRKYDFTGATREFFSHTLLVRIPSGSTGLPMTSCVETYPSGAKDYYGFVPSTVLIDMLPVAFLTARTDPYGHSTQFVYQETNNSVTLLYVIDGDGRTNTLSYTNSTFPTQITGVTDPFGRTTYLQYDNNGMLTNCIDVAGLTNSFTYDGQGWVTKLITPYGTTTFQNYTNSTSTNEFGLNSATNYNPFLPIRAVKIIDPVGGTNLYMLRQDSTIAYTNPADFYNNTNNYIPFLPSQYSSLLPFGPTPTLDTNSDALLYYRDSFHWGPRQAAGLPTDFTTFAPTNFYRGRMRHWLHNGVSGNAGISQVLDIEQAPSPDGITLGQTTWFDYDGKGDNRYIGASSLPSLIARVVPDGTTRYTWLQRDEWGRPTNIVQSYSSSYGASPLTRTNSFVYDANGVNLVRIIGAFGEMRAGYAYDTTNQLLRATNAVGDVRYFTYDGEGRVTSVKTEAGLTHTNIYFASGPYTNWVQTSIDLDINRTNSYTYTNDLVYTHTDERGLITTFTHDNLQRVTSASDSRGVVTFAYNKLDLARVVDRMGFTNSYGFDSVRRMTAATNTLGRYTLYNYCTCGALDSIRDAAGNFTYFYYDNAGRLTNTIYADNFSVSRQYSLLGQVTNLTDSAGTSATNWFSNQGLVYAVSNSFGQVKGFAFDLEDRTTNSIDANGVSVATTYDALGRVRTRTYPDNGMEKFGYSAAGLTAYTNQLGFTNFYVYDPAARKTFETNANLELTQFQYSPAGDLTNLIDGKSQSTKWNYDQYGRVTNKVDAAGNTSFVYGYDLDNRLTNRLTPAKGTTTYRFDPAGNLTNVVYPLNTALILKYDALNRLTNLVDGVGVTVYSYDAAGQILSEDGPWVDDTVSYVYTNRLRASLSLVAPNASPWTEGYGYDAAKRLTTLTSPAGGFSYGYDTSRHTQISSLALPGGAYITNTFDPLTRLLSTMLKNSTNGVLNSHQYGNDLAGKRLWLTNVYGDYHQFRYDKIGELNGAAGYESNGTARLQEQLAYAYDAAHNLNGRTNNAFWENFSVNNLNELNTVSRSTTNLTVAGTTTSPATNVTINGSTANRYADSTFALGGFALVNGNNTFTAIAQDAVNRKDTNSITVNLPASASYSYDLNGNLLSDGNRNFAYDDENQLISIWVANVWRSDFVYDGKFRRRSRFESTWNGSAWATNTTVRYVYDGSLVIQERDANNLPLVSYTRGRDLSGSLQGAGGIGGLLARTDHSLSTLNSALSTAFYHCDGNGNVTSLIYSNQCIAARYLYDPYGNILSKAGALADANLYRFSSKELHVTSGLVYYLYRFYDSVTQRWLNRDPLGVEGGMNLYSFVRNGPAIWFDATGLVDGDATIQCKGGKYEVVLNFAKGKPYESCVRAHEEQHIKDWKDRYGENSCQGVPDGSLPKPGADYEKFLHDSECKAHAISRDCEKALAKGCKDIDDSVADQAQASSDNNYLGKNKCPQYQKDFKIFD